MHKGLGLLAQIHQAQEVASLSSSPPLFSVFVTYSCSGPSFWLLLGQALSLLSLPSHCLAVTSYFWSNDSQLSTPRQLSRPLSTADSSTDEITH